MSTETPEIVEIHGELRLVPLHDIEEGMAGAALVDARGTEVERITAPAARFDADDAFRRLDTRRNQLAGYRERLRNTLRTATPSSAAGALELRWMAGNLAPWSLPLLVGAAQTWYLWGTPPTGLTTTAMILELLVGLFLVVAALQPPDGPGEAGVLWLALGSMAGLFVVYGMESSEVVTRSPDVYVGATRLVGGLFTATLVQAVLVLCVKGGAAPLPVLRTLDLSAAPASGDAVVLLCVQTHMGRAVPSLAVRYDTAAGEPAFYTLLPLRRVDGAPAAAVALLANHALAYASREQQDARLVAESRERLGELEKSMRELG